MKKRAVSRGLALGAVSAAAAFAQTISAGGTLTSTIPVPSRAVLVQNGVAFAGGPSNQVAGQPYSAQQETQTIQTLADGTHITNGVQKVTYYRDSSGRTRTERTGMQPPGPLGTSTPPVFIDIADPVGGYRYTLDPNSHTAHRAPFGPVEGVRRVVASPPPVGRTVNGQVVLSPAFVQSSKETNAQRPRPEISSEQLGTQTIEGVLAEGVRTTTTYPVGFFGNDRPITTVSETWMSRELGMAVLTKTSDPRNGETTMRMTNISRAEPDASLFQPPADYEIVDPQK